MKIWKILEKNYGERNNYKYYFNIFFLLYL